MKFTARQIEYLESAIEMEGLRIACVDADIFGHVLGDVKGHVEGDVKGHVCGDVKGGVWGDVKGNVEGTVNSKGR